MDNNKLLIVSEDLEHHYHRGIAFYSKSLLKATYSLGYENFLLTGAPKTSSKQLKELFIFKNLVQPVWKDYGKKKKIFYYAKKHFLPNALEHIPINHQHKILEKESRLDFVQHLNGFINNPYQYLEFDFHPRLFDSAIAFDVSKMHYKAVISTNPLPLKVKGAPFIQTLHDIIPVSTLMHPDSPQGLERFYKRLVKMLKHSDYLLSVSEYSRMELLKFFPGYENKIITKHIAVPISSKEAELAYNEKITSSILELHGLSKGQFFLYIGAIEERKNIAKMLEAYDLIKKKIGIPLVLAGELDRADHRLKKKISENKDVLYLGQIDNLSKLVLLKSATAFLFPSKYEGFGIPPLEAMFMGCPVLTSNVTSLPEICGDAALYVDPYKVEDMIDQMVEISMNETLRSQLIKKGFERVKLFSNEAYSQRLKTVLDLL